MREFEFSSALPVWTSGCENKMNETLCFTEKFSYCKDAVFKITACNFYRVFLNGEFLGFGPARAAEGYRRTDVYRIFGTEESNTLFIEVNAYRCNTLYDVNTQGLVQYELIADGETLFATGKNTRCAEFTPRNRAVMRFSYQRAFVEDYDYPVPIGDIYAGKSGIFKSLPCEIVPQAKYLPRGVNYPEYRPVTMRLIEGGTFSQTYDYFICRTRYMLNRNIGIFPLEEQKKNVNDYLCSLVYEKRAPSARIAAGQYALYRSQGSRTGFVYLSFTAFCDSEIILFFDEIDMRKTENEGVPAEICFYRNGTQNYVRMSVKACGNFPLTENFSKITACAKTENSCAKDIQAKPVSITRFISVRRIKRGIPNFIKRFSTNSGPTARTNAILRFINQICLSDITCASTISEERSAINRYSESAWIIFIIWRKPRVRSGNTLRLRQACVTDLLRISGKLSSIA